MNLKPFKFVVQAVLTEHDDTGNVIGEHTHEPAVVYGTAKLEEYARDFAGELERALAERNTEAT